MGVSELNRNVSLDILKIVLAFMIVGIHAGFLSSLTSAGSYLTVNGVFRIAVPIFLLIGGFYFYAAILKGKASDWLKRVLYLYIFWMLFYSIFWLNLDFSFLGFAKIMIIGYYHLWYLPGMLGAAILVVVLNKLPLGVMIFSICITFIIGVIIQYLGNYHVCKNSDVDRWFNIYWVHRNFIFFAFPFFSIGFLINKYELHAKISLKQSIICSFIGMLLLLFESYLNYIVPSRDGGFDNFGSLLIISPAIFILFMKINYQGRSKELALYSSGVYFIHIFLLRVYKNHTDFDGTVLTIIVFLSSVFVTYFLIRVNRRFKFIL
mgnify:CR=1 FL=1